MELDEQIQQSQGKTAQKKDFAKYFKLSDKLHNISDKKPQQFLEKGSYMEQKDLINNLLRGESNFKEEFKLYHRPLRPFDHNLQLGDDPKPYYSTQRL